MANRKQLPPIDRILDTPQSGIDKTVATDQAKRIETSLADFGLEVTVRDIRQGPTLTQFSLKPGPNVKVNQIKKLSPDLALALSGLPITLEDPTANYPFLRMIVPNNQRDLVRLRPILESAAFQKHKGVLKVGLGVDTFDQHIIIDLASLPHLLIGGSTGSGKSMCLNGIVASLLCTYTPKYLRLVLIDPLQIELKQFGAIPHLLVPVASQAEQILNVLASLNTEVNRRYTAFSKRAVRSIEGYNQQIATTDEEKMPYLVIIIDNLTDLMLASAREIEQALSRITAMGRGAGIHLVFATQRSNVDVVSGAIKANASGRIAFRVVNSADSRLILDTSGAEDLYGPGDMLYKTSEVPIPQRGQGVYVSERELVRLTGFWGGR